MEKIITSIVFLILSFYLSIFSAQETTFQCGLNERLKSLYEEDPSLFIAQQKLIKEARRYSKEKIENATIYTIPLVFHVLHEYGIENISDQQIVDQVSILNRDFRMRNQDTSEIVPEFKGVKSDVFIEFKLATKDPAGNCTNGIEHIYTHEAFQGDDNSKLNQWPREKYLNIWVVARMSDDKAGYSFYPSAVDGVNFFKDGVIILNKYIGSIGTGSLYNSRALTHEVGHYLGLPHPWGSTNKPGVQCGNDGIDDTPVTKGSNLACNINNSKICNPQIVENVQNYMEYSYCSRMFTNDQAVFMRYNLTNNISDRNNLITEQNHLITGIDVLQAPNCSPQADFSASTQFICEGSSVTFNDASWRAAVDSRVWSFEGGNPQSSNLASPTVTFSTPGYKKVSLTVTNAVGTTTLLKENFIYVSASWPDFVGPFSNDMDGEKGNWFLVLNPEDNDAHFSLEVGMGKNHSKCYRLNNYKDTKNAAYLSDDYFYAKRLGGNKDGIISPSFDLSNTSDIIVSFDYAYKTDGTNLVDVDENNPDIVEKVNIYSSKNCGANWKLQKSIPSKELLTVENYDQGEFTPMYDGQWKTFSFKYISTSQDKQTRFKIEFLSSDVSNNFFVDNFNVTGILELNEVSNDDFGISIYPNPVSPDSKIQLVYIAGDQPMECIIRDLQGKTIYIDSFFETNTKVEQTLNLPIPLESACYFVELKSGNFSTVKKIVVL